MSFRFSLSNYFRSLSWDQFQSLASDFEEQCVISFDGACEIEIRAMSSHKIHTTHWPDQGTMRYIDTVNEKSTFFKTNNTRMLTPEIFKEAVFIEVALRPKDKARALRSAFATIDFKGKLRRRATFYIQCGKTPVVANMRLMNPFMKYGDGSRYHCDPG